MQLLQLVTELETDVAVANAVSPLRLLTFGKYLDLKLGKTVIDFGCGHGEMLCLWARHFGVTGIGVDIDPGLLIDAAERAERWGIADRDGIPDPAPCVIAGKAAARSAFLKSGPTRHVRMLDVGLQLQF